MRDAAALRVERVRVLRRHLNRSRRPVRVAAPDSPPPAQHPKQQEPRT